MDLSLFDFYLPPSAIAQIPCEPRDVSRLLVVKQGCFEQHFFYELADFLNPGDVVVLNDTRVIPARLLGKRDAVAVELLLHKRLVGSDTGDAVCWQVFAKPAKRLKPGQKILFADGFAARVIDKAPNGEVAVAFDYSEEEFRRQLLQYGLPPLPPYIGRDYVRNHSKNEDAQRYQTVYAQRDGAVAAPTAGLHFTDRLMEQLKKKSVNITYVTLHVGAGTFMPVKVQDTRDHTMHSEWYEISEQTARHINDARRNGGRVVAVGTTSVRVLETVADSNGVIIAGSGDTSIFITPGYQFKAVDLLITNFHLPKSTLFMLVSAFAGLACMQSAYRTAIDNGFRFYSYGDACLLYKNDDDARY